jgi:hypothetical protein
MNQEYLPYVVSRKKKIEQEKTEVTEICFLALSVLSVYFVGSIGVYRLRPKKLMSLEKTLGFPLDLSIDFQVLKFSSGESK